MGREEDEGTYSRCRHTTTGEVGESGSDLCVCVCVCTCICAHVHELHGITKKTSFLSRHVLLGVHLEFEYGHFPLTDVFYWGVVLDLGFLAFRWLWYVYVCVKKEV